MDEYCECVTFKNVEKSTDKEVIMITYRDTTYLYNPHRPSCSASCNASCNVSCTVSCSVSCSALCSVL